MTFHTTTYPRIREMVGTVSVEHRATMYYSDINCDIGDAIAVVMGSDVKEMRGDDTSIG